MLPTQTPSGPPRMSRLGIFTSRQTPSRPGPSSPLAREADDDQDDDWYIPYNGPYETPKRQQPLPHSGDSWGELLNGWLSEDDGHGQRGGYRQEGRVSQATSAPEDRSRSRAVSGASRLTHSTGGPDANGKNNGARNHQLRASARQRAPTLSYIDLDRSGGVGASPTPIERSSSQPLADTSRLQPSPSNRTSLASIFTFGRKSLRLSASMDNLAQARSRNSSRDKVNTPVEPAPPPVPPVRTIPARPRAKTTAASTSPTQGRMSADDEYYNTYYNTLIVTPGKNHAPPTGDSDTTDTSMRSHPYAYPFPSADVPEALQSAPPVVDKGKGRLLVPRKLSITLLDPRGPKVPAYLKPSPRSSVLKASLSTPNLRNIPKGKQRWLSAETWCDALILPRPRFALRLVDTTGASGRIVSPPPSPILPTRTPDPNTIQPRPGMNKQKALKKARSMGNLISTSRSPTPPEQQKRDITPDPHPPVPVAGSSTLKPPRPRSFAWDDLALPSPVPSLAKVLEEGRQLEEERKKWQKEASRSVLDKRAGNMSRARSKSIGAPRSHSRGASKDAATAFEALAERTLLGNQIRPPTIHVHGPSIARSRSSHHTRSHSQSQTMSGNGQTTLQSSTTHGPFNRPGSGRTRSHAHSNSLGNSLSAKSMSGESSSSPGHSRSHSIGKTAFKLVVSTATSAAAFCGLTSPTGERADIMDEAMDNALQNSETKVIRLQDQIRAEEKQREHESLLVISPGQASAALAMVTRTGISPTPSALSGSGSGEGVGIAISSPSEEPARQLHQGREPIRLPSHPYAQGATYPQAFTTSSPETYHHPPRPFDHIPTSATADSLASNQHRQPVLLHPYSQPGHPYATASQGRSRPPDINVPPAHLRMYAELTPGHIRQLTPGDIRYSPDIPTPAVVLPAPDGQAQQQAGTSSAAGHPYGPQTKRTSELGFGEALVNTMRRGSLDSGIGTSESGAVDWERRAADLSPDSAVDDIVRMHDAMGPRQRMNRFPPEHKPSAGAVSNHTTASSPPEHLNPPAFRRTMSGLSAGHTSQYGHSSTSGSSPGVTSHESSPPLSPRVINTTEDLERFRDLFFRPNRQNSIFDSSAPSMTRRPSGGSILLDVGSQRSTTSGLSTLARQLSEELEELRHELGTPEIDLDAQRWGGRFGGLRGPRPQDMIDDPNVVLAQLSSSGSNPSATNSPMRLPIDTSFMSPSTNVPEDVESSRASSILEPSPLKDNELDAHFRFGAIEAMPTPSIVNTPNRFSTELSLIGHGPPVDHNRLHNEAIDTRHISERSTLLTPISPNARSSYMTSGTDTSRISGLSDFPAPPTLFLPPASMPLHGIPDVHPPRLEREPSYATFGRSDDEYTIGEAL